MNISLPPIPHRALVDFSDASDPVRTEVLILGSGSAALRAAIEAAGAREVLVLTKQSREEGATRYAQGGIAASVSERDAPGFHLEDTLRTGIGLCDEKVADMVIGEGPERIRELVDWGARFDRDNGELHLGREGGHTRRRVIHHADETGLELERALLHVAVGNPKIRIVENAFAVDLLCDGGACAGALAFLDGRLRPVPASRTILATGGFARIYRESTNPPVATGDGAGMALRAGAELMDMEFVQFHPTTLYIAGAVRALVSERVRGAGAVLRDGGGAAFMKDVHEMADLAPRDVVARACLNRIRETGETHVYLDVRHLPEKGLRQGFPGLVRLCEKFGLDVHRDLIPVRPSAHYTIGGVRTDPDGATNVPGLYAVGECAATGFHGANRLASNSLLECLVFGRRAGRHAAETAGAAPGKFAPLEGPKTPGTDLDVTDLTNSLQSLMTRQAGIERGGENLKAALARMEFWSRYVLDRTFRDAAGWQLQNALMAARAVAASAVAREESRGVHYRTDFPGPRDDWKKHITASLGSGD
ncbi:MAG: L-aspartate oxidase [Planctomycetota bacterium]